MSGIEIASIALAVFPVVANGISGLTEGAKNLPDLAERPRAT